MRIESRGAGRASPPLAMGRTSTGSTNASQPALSASSAAVGSPIAAALAAATASDCPSGGSTSPLRAHQSGCEWQTWTTGMTSDEPSGGQSLSTTAGTQQSVKPTSGGRREHSRSRTGKQPPVVSWLKRKKTSTRSPAQYAAGSSFSRPA
eukprot:5869469-Prymnesium_polylepis.1